MIPLAKLAKLSPNHRFRKAALVLGGIERTLLARAENPVILAGEEAERLDRYIRELSGFLARDRDAPESVRAAASSLLLTADAEPATAALRDIDRLRHTLLSHTGQAPADWDLIDPRTGLVHSGMRRVVPGIKVYLEDLRSPFNVGAIFRTAEAFGFEEILLSPACADPRHPRALRSAMGAVELLPWKRAEIKDIVGPRSSSGGQLFALELGGTSLEEFCFPRTGVMVVGSEELGVSPEARSLCEGRIVSIPLSGVKGSLNAAVAFGIAAYAWLSSIQKDGWTSSKSVERGHELP